MSALVIVFFVASAYIAAVVAGWQAVRSHRALAEARRIVADLRVDAELAELLDEGGRS